MKTISSPDIIWRFHVNPSDAALFLECKNNSKRFYLWEPNTNKKWHFPELDQYVCTIINLQYPYVVLSYFHEENLMNQSILMVYNLEVDKEMWSSSELKLEECYAGILKVYPAKITPKRYEYISLEKEKIEDPTLVELILDVQHADKQADKHILNFKNTEVSLSITEPAQLVINQPDKKNIVREFDIEGIRTEYDYLIRIANNIVLLIDNHQLLLFDSE